MTDTPLLVEAAAEAAYVEAAAMEAAVVTKGEKEAEMATISRE